LYCVGREKADNSSMKTAMKITSALMAVAFCSTAFATEPAKATVKLAKKKTYKVCYAVITGSGIPQPCERLSVIPTTAQPLDRVGSGSK
jgi:hypothetical protein